MSRRVRQLEDALQIAQASLSSSIHPLLAEDLLSIKHGVDAPDDLQKELSNPEWDIYTSFGTLSISDRGETRFVGRSSSEVCDFVPQLPVADKQYRFIGFNGGKQNVRHCNAAYP